MTDKKKKKKTPEEIVDEIEALISSSIDNLDRPTAFDFTKEKVLDLNLKQLLRSIHGIRSVFWDYDHGKHKEGPEGSNGTDVSRPFNI